MSATLVSDDAGQAVDASAIHIESSAPQKSSKTSQFVDDSGAPVGSGVAGVVQQDGQIVAAILKKPKDFYDYLVYEPSFLPARVYTDRKIMFFYPDQALYAVLSRTLEAIQWIQLVSWNNNTSIAQQYHISYTTELMIIEGSEISVGFNFKASFEGMSISVDGNQKTFKPTETTSIKEITLTVNVPAYSELIFYQKCYKFEDYVTFVLDAWGQEWNVGPWGGYNPLTSMHVLTHIMAEDYFMKSSPLPAGPGKMLVSAVGPPVRAWTSATRKRENTTERCKNLLAKMGL